MTLNGNTLILHQYEVSPYSEKVRVALGMKQLEWYACDQPVIMPKPELLQLTGGYRRIPVLQIGADLYFDTGLIIDELERRFPSPSVYGGCGQGMAQVIGKWSDEALFWPVVQALFGGDWEYDDAFIADRSALIGAPFTREAMNAAVPEAERQLRVQFDLIDRQLADKRLFLFGDRPSVADAAVYHNVAFIRWGKGRTAGLLSPFSWLLAWEARMRAIGHGRRGHDITRGDAIGIARDSRPIAIARDGLHDDLRKGDTVRIVYKDADSAPLEAIVEAVDRQALSVRPLHSAIEEMMIHLPFAIAAVSRL